MLKAAGASRLEDLRKLVIRAPRTPLTRREQLALEVVMIAFSTLSRAFEISVLTVDNVAVDGCYIMVRPKMAAREWKLYKKCVADVGRLRPATILAERRREAIREGKTYLFAWGEDNDLPPETSQLSSALKSATFKLGVDKRITAHSARKGAAVELLLNGTPIPVIRAWGIWAQLESLEAYLGRTLREEVPLLQFMPEAAQP